MDKPRVIFPYVEAGLGHIMPMNSIADEFERLYGDKVECVRSVFFTETGNKKAKKFEDKLKREVVKYNKNTAYGFFATFSMDFWRSHVSSWMTMTVFVPGSRKPAERYLDELKPDLVVSTHWATNFYAKKCKSKPLTAMYCPDARINPLFRYPCDLVMISTVTGYEQALKRHRHRFNKDNIKLVPFLIRNEAFSTSTDKAATREKLGLDKDKFTVLLAEGGYGIGKMYEICKEVLKRDLPVTLMPVCGKNTKLYEKFLTMKSKGKTDFKPMGLVDNMFELIVASDVFCGKSGASMIAEPCFFCVPQIITKYADNIEKYIGEYYINTVGSAIKIFKPEKVADKIEEFMRSPEKLEPYRKAAAAHHKNFGATVSAKYIFDLLCTRFPHLKDEKKSEK